jgi:hypothetical protein
MSGEPGVYNCPLLRMPCIKGACMLYNDEKECCAIMIIAQAVEDMAETIYVHTG